MTISSFCHDLLLAGGPLPLESLARRAADAGVTRARDPEAAVRSAIADAEVQLPDGRWTTPLHLLEGRILTARRLPLCDAPWFEDRIDGTEYDVAPLDRALRSGPVPLAGGGELRRSRSYGAEWIAPKGWPDVDVGSDELLGLRIRGGTLHLEVVPVTEALHSEGEQLARALGHLRSRDLWSYWRTDDIAATLWARLATDAELLTRPTPPLSRCVPALAETLRARREELQRQASRWTVTLELPAALQEVAIRAAHRDDDLVPDWMSAFVARQLRDLDDQLEQEWHEEEYGRLLRLPRQR